MNQIITLQRNQDNGYGVVSCIQKQDFDLSNIHEYFKGYDDDYNFNEPFKDVDSVVSFLNKVMEDENYDFIHDMKNDLKETDIWDHFNSTLNPKGSGNQVDDLVLTYNGEVLFNS
jgi:hypothetical protein